MKKLLLLCSLFLGLALLHAAVAPGENLLVNGEFASEDFDPQSGLTTKAPTFWGPTGSIRNLSFSSRNVPAGKGIVKFSAPKGEISPEVTLRQMDLTLVPGAKYRISAMVKIREISNVPVILLTAKSEDADKIMGLNSGADDYITKPFNPNEVVARVRSQLRRYTQLGSGTPVTTVITIGGLELNDTEKSVTLDGEALSLRPKEYDILKLLMGNPGKVYSTKEIYRSVWKDSPAGSSENTVAVHIRHLREKIEINPNEPRYLKVIWGQGYKIEKEKENGRK